MKIIKKIIEEVDNRKKKRKNHRMEINVMNMYDGEKNSDIVKRMTRK